MFSRKKDTYAEVDGFAAAGGVSFCIHVFYKDNPGAAIQVKRLAPTKHKLNLLGVRPRNHPDQEYLTGCGAALAQLANKTYVRVEVDVTINFCGDAQGQCGEVVPAWVWQNFPNTPAYLFLHKSDLPDYTPGGKHVFDLYTRVNNESWEWTDGDQTVWPPRYVAVYTCTRGGCARRNDELLLIEVDDPNKKGRAAMQVVPLAKQKCPTCNMGLEHKETREIGIRENIYL